MAGWIVALVWIVCLIVGMFWEKHANHLTFEDIATWTDRKGWS